MSDLMEIALVLGKNICILESILLIFGMVTLIIISKIDLPIFKDYIKSTTTGVLLSFVFTMVTSFISMGLFIFMGVSCLFSWDLLNKVITLEQIKNLCILIVLFFFIYRISNIGIEKALNKLSSYGKGDKEW